MTGWEPRRVTLLYGLQPYKVVYYNRMTVVLQILTPRFTNFKAKRTAVNYRASKQASKIKFRCS